MAVSCMSSSASFSLRLIAWQRQHGRHHLPWQSPDPYRVWVSEIMLQQTQVSTVLGFYERFIARFPDVATLAAAQLDDVLALWSGLGYYTRARNLHRAARLVEDTLGGVFPVDPAELERLPGIGRSTAAAIAAFAAGARVAILDGNVKRVLTRWAGIEGWPGDKKVEARLWQLATLLLPPGSGDMAAYTQGQMDLGSLVCTRSKPGCGVCPLSLDCVAYRDGRCRELPTPRPKKTIPVRDACWLLAQDEQGRVLLTRRPEQGIWGGLWSLPELASSDAVDEAASALGFAVRDIGPALPEVEHVFTHFRLIAIPVPVQAQPLGCVPDCGWFTAQEREGLGLPAPVRRLLSGL